MIRTGYFVMKKQFHKVATFPSVIISQMYILQERQHSCKACKSVLMTSYISIKADAKKAH